MPVVTPEKLSGLQRQSDDIRNVSLSYLDLPQKLY